MAEWKKDIKSLAKGFNISKAMVKFIIDKVEDTYSQREMGSYRKGNRNDYLYDKARTEIMRLVMA